MKVIKPGRADKKQERQEVSCTNCEAVLEVNKGDLLVHQSVRIGDMYAPDGYSRGFHYVICPECGEQVEVEGL